MYKNWKLKHNLLQTLIALDQLIRCLIGLIACFFNPKVTVWADETMSAYCYRKNEIWYVKILEVLVNVIMLPFERFKWDHCKRAYESEIIRQQSPKYE